MLNDYENIKKELLDFLSDCSSLVILGIGNDIRGDDGFGPYIVNQLSVFKECSMNHENSEPAEYDSKIQNDFYRDSDEFYTGNIPLNFDDDLNNIQEKYNFDEPLNFDFNKLCLINGGSVPENFTSPIKSYDPSHIIIIDAALMNLAPGEIRVINKENIASISVSTHSMSLNYLIRFLEIEKDYNILFLGMEPEIMDLSFELSETVQKTADNLIGIFISIFKEW